MLGNLFLLEVSRHLLIVRTKHNAFFGCQQDLVVHMCMVTVMPTLERECQKKSV